MHECPNCPSFESKDDFLDECTECGIGRTRTAGKLPKDCADYTPENAQQRKHFLSYYRAVYKKYLRNCSLDNKNVLEVGCSEGDFIDLLHKKRKDLDPVGIDPCGDFKPRPGIKFQNVSFADFEAPEKFGLIIMLHSFEHMLDPVSALKKCREILSSRGRILILVPNYKSWWARACGKDWPWYNFSGHYYHYTVKGIARIMEQQGFRIISLETRSIFRQKVPVMLNVYFSTRGIYSKGVLSIWPLRSIIYRMVDLLCRPLNYFFDRHMQGAEIQVLAEIKQAG